MEKGDKKWTKEQTIVAFNLYCKIPFNKVTSSHPEIIKIANEIGRSVNAVKMKIGNFGSFDPELKKRGIVGLTNVSKLDEEVWNEFNNNWGELAFESEKILSGFEGRDISADIKTFEDGAHFGNGIEKERIVKARVNQNFFRQTVLSAHNFSCCITGIDLPELLVASHIVPWSKSEKDRLNPRNGLCLNALHDRAFDVGLITVTPDFFIRVSSKVGRDSSCANIQKWIEEFDRKRISLPERFIPDKKFLRYHNTYVFRK